MTIERVLDWRSHHDERSRDYPIRGLLPGEPRSYTWACPPTLDQGVEGACVGFAWAHELAARPQVWEVSPGLAQYIYRQARRLDTWPGEDYEGSSVLGGAKAVQLMSYIGGYRWAFSVSDLAFGVGRSGPAVLGINWYESMWHPDENGYVEVAGDIVGGHAILCRGVNVLRRDFLLHNSWGIDWGFLGGCRVSFDGMEKLLADNGEACFPIRNTSATKATVANVD